MKNREETATSLETTTSTPSTPFRARMVAGIGTIAAAVTLVTLVAFGNLAAGCAPPPADEARGMTTSKLLKAHAATTLPASDTEDFVQAVGGVPVDIDSWAGYVAGTTKDALFEMHFSGLKKDKAVAGLSLAFIAAPGDPTTGDLQGRLASTARLEVRFHNGSGIVSSHTFPADGSAGTTDAAHQADPSSAALLQRAFSDSEALLRLPANQAGGGDKAAACMASFLAAVSGATRCVDDASNTDDCAAVRAEAVLTASSCNGPTTADVLAGHGSITPQSLPSLGSIGKIVSVFSALRGGSTSSFAKALGGGQLSQFTGLLGGLLGGGSKGGLGSLLGGKGLGGLSSALGSLGNLGGSSSGGGNILDSFEGDDAFDSGIFGGDGLGSDLFGNSDLGVDDLGDVFDDGF